MEIFKHIREFFSIPTAKELEKEFNIEMDKKVKELEENKRKAILRNYNGLRNIVEPYFKYADDTFSLEDPRRTEFIESIIRILNGYMDIATTLANTEHEVEITKMCMVRLSYDIVNASLKEK